MDESLNVENSSAPEVSNEDRRNILLCTHPRLTSNLFMRAFQAHPDIQMVEYSFLNVSECNPRKVAAMDLITGELEPEETLNARLEAEGLVKMLQTPFDIFISSLLAGLSLDKVAVIEKHVLLITDTTTLMDHSPDNLDRMEVPTRDVTGDLRSSDHNPTVLSNEVFDSFDVIILFRHPARLIPAYYRHCVNQIPGYSILDDRSVAVWASLRWLVRLEDWLSAARLQEAREIQEASETVARMFPIVIEADDIIHKPRILRRVCALTGIDVEHVQFQGDEDGEGEEAENDSENEDSEDNRDDEVVRLPETVSFDDFDEMWPEMWPDPTVFEEAADGVETGEIENMSEFMAQFELRDPIELGDPPSEEIEAVPSLTDGSSEEDELDLEQAKAEWQEEFGIEEAELIARFVDEAMDDYKYLRRFKL
ncbi:hypothetical protein MMC07_003976 [Pseudocyphellaria aurata]|nr:hypothetical protein [Pseudocyphellaria aurata]